MKKITGVRDRAMDSLSQLTEEHAELRKELAAANTSFEKMVVELAHAELDVSRLRVALESARNSVNVLRRRTDIYEAVLLLMGATGLLALFALLSINQL
jgi:chromosome segregation ATPase